MAATLVLELKDGTEVETTYTPRYSVQEQVAWEEEFNLSFVAISQCIDASDAALVTGKPLDPTKGMRTGWILWFGWFRARPKLPSNFKKFLTRLEDWRIELDDSPTPDEAPLPETGDGAEPGGRVDPTGTTESSATDR